MLNFILSVVFTVSLYLIMRAFPKYGVTPLHAVVFNYFSCVITGLMMSNNYADFQILNLTSTPTLLTLSLGLLFVFTFTTIGLTTQKVSVTVASLAGNMSLVIPVLFGLFIFKNNNKEFTFLNYLGLVLALVALGLSTMQENKANTEKSTPKNAWLWALPILLFLGSGSNNTLSNYLTMKYYRPDQLPFFIIIACSGAAVFGVIFLLFKMVFQNERVHWKSFVGGMILGVPNFLSFYFMLKALESFGNSAAFVFPIYNILCMLVSAGAAYVLFKEKLNFYNKIGLLVAVLAIILISYQELFKI